MSMIKSLIYVPFYFYFRCTSLTDMCLFLKIVNKLWFREAFFEKVPQMLIWEKSRVGKYKFEYHFAKYIILYCTFLVDWKDIVKMRGKHLNLKKKWFFSQSRRVCQKLKKIWETNMEKKRTNVSLIVQKRLKSNTLLMVIPSTQSGMLRWWVPFMVHNRKYQK